MIYRRIDSQNDPDISYLDEIQNLPDLRYKYRKCILL